MNKSNLSKFTRSVRASLRKHSPEILTGIGIAGMISTTIMAVRATPKALAIIEQEREERDTDELTKIEVVKSCWKCYIPTVVTGSLSIACLIGANSVHSRRNAALATVYKISEQALAEYKEKVIETIGEKKEKQVRDNIQEGRLEKNPVTKSEVIITGNGDALCYDMLAGRYFKSGMDKIKKAEVMLNKQITRDMYASLNDFYDEIDLPHTNIGYNLGWCLDDGYIDIDFASKIADDGTPCLVIDFSVDPKYGYDKFM